MAFFVTVTGNTFLKKTLNYKFLIVNKKAADKCARCCKNRQKWICHSFSNLWSVLNTQVFTAWLKHIVFRFLVHVCLACTQGKTLKTNTSGMPPAVWGPQGWMCVYRRALAGGGRDLVQNNGTTVECGAAGNILNQTQGSPVVWVEAQCSKTFIRSMYFLTQWHPELFSCAADILQSSFTLLLN